MGRAANCAVLPLTCGSGMLVPTCHPRMTGERTAWLVGSLTLVCASGPGLKKLADFFENRRNSAGSAGSDFKNRHFFKFKFGNFKKIKKSGKLCKKLDEILRTLVEKNFQISTILLDKIQIE
jgi:hypothetical protein